MSQRRKLKKTYVRAPEPPPEHAQRYQVLLEVISGKLTVSAAAKQLGMSRNHFQTLLHRGLEGLIDKSVPQQSGRPAKSPREAELEAEVERLRRQNARLQERVDTIDRLLGVAGDLLKGRVEPSRRAHRSKAESQKPVTEDEDASEDAEASARRGLDGALEMRRLGLTASLAATIVGAGESTLRRWVKRKRAGQKLRLRRGPARPKVTAEVAGEALAVLHQLGGQIGVRALTKQVPHLSRSRASELKSRALTELERKRKREATRIEITVPGVVRGFDAMCVQTTDGPRWLLIAADACIPFRTTGRVVESYDSASVALTLEADIERHGAPLAFRFDRWKAHSTDEVLAVLRKHGVLVLHGPPYYPRFYGQTERQNREHRRILDLAGPLDPSALASSCDKMFRALNELWPRRLLGWRTARQVWDNRDTVHEDRDQMRDEVAERAARLARKTTARGLAPDFFERIALERALERRGYLRRLEGGWC